MKNKNLFNLRPLFVAFLYLLCLTAAQQINAAPVAEATPVLVKDINSTLNTASSNPQWLTAVGSTIFFIAGDNTHGVELWKSDGTAAGTVLVKDIRAGSSGSNPVNLTNVNGTLFFSADDGINGRELWKSDGTAAGTVLVKDIRAGTGSSSPVNLTNVNGTLFFRAVDGINGEELWKSDGTAAGTVLVKDIRTGTGGSNLHFLTNVNGTLFFSADDGINGEELWKSDGTAAGTVLVKDIYPGSSLPFHLTNVNGTLFFRAFDGINGTELWKSDGTAAGTVLVKDISAGFGSSSPHNLTDVNGTLFFNADDGINGFELWKSDGTAAGTVLVKDITPGTGGSNLQFLTNVNGMLFFSAIDGINGQELWKSDGTAAGTVLVKDISAGTGGSSPQSLTNVNGTLFFNADDGINGRELWKSDGTAAGTIMVSNITGDSANSLPANLTQVGTKLFFAATTEDFGRELYVLQVSVKYTISGQITTGGNALPGATVALSGSAIDTATTDAAGNYSFTIDEGGSYTVTPSLDNYSFTPPDVSFSNLSANQTADFTAVNTCTYSIDPSSVNTVSGSNTGTVTVTAPSGCAWSAVSNDLWLTITSETTGSGDGIVGYSVEANTGQARSGTLTIAGQSFTVTQAAAIHSLSGEVTYATTPADQSAMFVSGVNLNAAGTSNASASTDNGGIYQISGLTTGGSYLVTPSKSGQINGISNADATAIAQHVANLITLNPSQQIAADVTGNGSISSLDAAYVAQHVAGISNPGITGTWKFNPVNRTYNNIENDYTNENYTALLMGEVTGNWNPSMPESESASGKESFEQQSPAEYVRRTVKESGLQWNNENNRQNPIKENISQTGAEGGAGPVTVSAPNPKVVNPGENFVFELTASDTTGRDIFGYEFNFLYDSSVILPQANPCDAAGTLSDPAIGRTVLCNPLAPGNLRVVMFSSTGTPLSGAGVLLKLNFTAVGMGGTSTAITFQNFMFNEGIPQAIPVAGQVQFLGPTSASASVSGRVVEGKSGRSANAERGVARARVSFIDAQGQTRTTYTNQMGYYRFDSVAVGVTYVFTVSVKGREFAPQAVTVNETVENLNFASLQ